LQLFFNNEHSLYSWKRHPCTSNVWRQLTDWREQVTTWSDLYVLLCSHGDIVFPNPSELYWIGTINKYFNVGCVTCWSLCIIYWKTACQELRNELNRYYSWKVLKL
jgi:hypothetical protein